MSEWTRNTPWRQGHFLSREALEELDLSDLSTSDQVAIVVTHDCDLASITEIEPTVEVIVGHVVEKNGNHTHAKNPRRLHLEVQAETPFWVELHSQVRRSIDKSKIAKFTPRSDWTLSKESKSTLQIWLASRYRRSAFPDEFENRLSDAKFTDKIAKILKPHGEHVLGLFFDVDDGNELDHSGPNDPYVLDIVVLHNAELDSDAASSAAQKVVSDLVAAFKSKFCKPSGWEQIELRSCDAVSDEELTYKAFRHLNRWRLDHVSVSASPQQPIISE